MVLDLEDVFDTDMFTSKHGITFAESTFTRTGIIFAENFVILVAVFVLKMILDSRHFWVLIRFRGLPTTT